MLKKKNEEIRKQPDGTTIGWKYAETLYNQSNGTPSLACQRLTLIISD